MNGLHSSTVINSQTETPRRVHAAQPAARLARSCDAVGPFEPFTYISQCPASTPSESHQCLSG